METLTVYNETFSLIEYGCSCLSVFVLACFSNSSLRHTLHQIHGSFMSPNPKVPIFGEKQNRTDRDCNIRHDFLHSRVPYWIAMNTVSQELSRELRGQMYTCVFCDTVWQRLQEGNAHRDLESLYLEHLQKYHGMSV